MLKLLRKYSRSWVIALAIGAIVIVFIFWGIGGFRSARFQEVATVNGTPILITAYIRQYNNLIKEYQERSKGELSEQDFKALRLRERALNLLIEQVLLAQAAERLGISVSTPELQEWIQKMPYFQANGRFSNRRYQALLARARISPADFEAQERQNLLNQKVIETVTAFAKVSEGELQELFRLAQEEVEVDYLVVSPEPYEAKQRPSEEAVAAYFKKHQDKFRVPDRVRVRFMLFRSQDYKEEAKPSPKEVTEYISENEEEFSRPKVIRVRELFLAIPSKATPAKRQELEKKARSLWQEAKMTEDFAKLVETHSQDADNRKKGGDLGDIKRGDKPAAWENVAFSLSFGEVGLAKTDKGFHVIKIEEIKETERVPEAEARKKASQKLLEDKSLALAREAAQRARGEVTGATFVEVAKKFKAAMKESPLFARTDRLPDLGVSRAFTQAALALKKNDISKVVDMPNGFAIIQSLERQPAHIPPLEKVKEKVGQAVRLQKAKAEAEKEAAGLLERLRQGEPLTKAAAKAKLPIRKSGFFTRSQGFLKQTLAQSLTSAAFQLSQQKPYPLKPFLWRDQYYVLAFKARRVPSPEEFKREEEQVRRQVLESKKRLLFQSWLAQERKQADIKIYEVPS